MGGECAGGLNWRNDRKAQKNANIVKMDKIKEHGK